MKWYYVENGQQAGPVDEAQLAELVQAGKLRGDTLVWHEGMAAWQAFSTVKPAEIVLPESGTTSATPFTGETTEAVCAECGKIFRKDEMIPHGGVFICSNCKPVFLQRVRVGLSGTVGSVPGAVTEAQVRARDYEHDIGAYWTRAWEAFKSDPGLMIGVFVVFCLCFFVVNVIPYLSTITSLVFSGPLLGGLFAFFLMKIRNQPTTFGDSFSGFGPYFGQLLLGNLIPNLLIAAIMIPFIIVFALLFALVVPSMQGNSSPTGAQMALMIGGGLVVFIGVCVAIYFQYCWMFTLWLVRDKQMAFWPAMSLSRAVVRKHWWQNFLLGLVAGLLAFVGVLCCVGILVTGPIAVGMFAAAYERLFGDMQSA
jgi:hypothetical protein